jgi:hypothetical protein
MTLLNQPIRSHRVNEEQLCIAPARQQNEETKHQTPTININIVLVL